MNFVQKWARINAINEFKKVNKCVPCKMFTLIFLNYNLFRNRNLLNVSWLYLCSDAVIILCSESVADCSMS